MNTVWPHSPGLVSFWAIEPCDWGRTRHTSALPVPLSGEEITENWGDTKRAHCSWLVRVGTVVLCPGLAPEPECLLLAVTPLADPQSPGL